MQGRLRCFAAMSSNDAIDATMRLVVLNAASGLAPRVDAGGEEALRAALVEAIRRRTDWLVATERVVPIEEFQGVGPVDILLHEASEATPWGLIECKWSTDMRRDKIIEGAWDVIKLALATRRASRCGWLVTGAPTSSWATTETADLFAAGTVHTRELWNRRLRKRGANGGNTVGEECELGGRGNRFTHAPTDLVIAPVATARTPSGSWEIRASRVRGRGPLVWFADPPEFPSRLNQAWLDGNVPDMDQDTFARLLTRLRQKRWTELEISERVLPLRQRH
jgi:hypothetical protein